VTVTDATTTDLVAQGIDARDGGDLLRALRLFEEAAARTPAAARPPFEAARVLRRLGLSGTAKRRLDEALRHDPDLRGADLVAGLVAAARGDHEGALEACRAAIAANPDTVLPHAVAAQQLRKLQRHAEALELAESALARIGGESVVALRDERAFALVSLGQLEAARAALAETVPMRRTDEAIWDAARILDWQRRFEEALELVDALEPSARRHAHSFARYGLRRARIEVARRASRAVADTHATRPNSRLIHTAPYEFAEERPLDALDLERIDGTEPRKYYVFDESPQPDPDSAVMVDDLWPEPDLQRKLTRRPSPVSFLYVVRECFVQCERFYRRSDRHAVVTRTGHFVPDLVPERCLMHWSRLALWDPDDSLAALPLAFVLPTIGWDSHFHSVVDVLSTLVLYKRLKLTCPIIVPGPVSEMHHQLIAGSGISADVPILTAQEVRGRLLKVAVCPAPGRTQGEGSVTGEALRAWSRALRANLGRDPEPARPGDVLYISRSGVPRRRLINETQLEASLEARANARVAHMEEMPLEEQVAAMQGARVVVAPHGAGLTNLLFAEPGITVVELFPDDYVLPHYAWLATRLGHTHVGLAGRAEGRATSQNDLDWSIDIERVHAALDRALAVEVPNARGLD
jgi:capsular polysaccharide biosynthesis protein/tetratricopeptide (TPR) repeat protein